MPASAPASPAPVAPPATPMAPARPTSGRQAPAPKQGGDDSEHRRNVTDKDAPLTRSYPVDSIASVPVDSGAILHDGEASFPARPAPVATTAAGLSYALDAMLSKMRSSAGAGTVATTGVSGSVPSFVSTAAAATAGDARGETERERALLFKEYYDERDREVALEEQKRRDEVERMLREDDMPGETRGVVLEEDKEENKKAQGADDERIKEYEKRISELERRIDEVSEKEETREDDAERRAEKRRIAELERRVDELSSERDEREEKEPEDKRARKAEKAEKTVEEKPSKKEEKSSKKEEKSSKKEEKSSKKEEEPTKTEKPAKEEKPKKEKGEKSEKKYYDDEEDDARRFAEYSSERDEEAREASKSEKSSEQEEKPSKEKPAKAEKGVKEEKPKKEKKAKDGKAEEREVDDRLDKLEERIESLEAEDSEDEVEEYRPEKEEKKPSVREERNDALRFADYSKERDAEIAERREAAEEKEEPTVEEESVAEAEKPSKKEEKSSKKEEKTSKEKPAKEEPKEEAAPVVIVSDAEPEDEIEYKAEEAKPVSRRDEVKDAIAFKEYSDARDAVIAERVAEAEAARVVPGKSYGEHNVDEVIAPIVIGYDAPGKADEVRDALAFKEYSDARDAVLAERAAEAEAARTVPGQSYDIEDEKPGTKGAKAAKGVSHGAEVKDERAYAKYDKERDALLAERAAQEAAGAAPDQYAPDDEVKPAVSEAKPVSKSEQMRDAVAFKEYSDARDAVLAERAAEAEAARTIPGQSYDVEDEKPGTKGAKAAKGVSHSTEVKDERAYAKYDKERDAVLAKRMDDAEAGVVVPGKSYGEHTVDEVIEPIVIDPKTVSEAERSHDALAFARYNAERDAVLAKRMEDAEAGVVVPGKSYGEHSVDEVIEPIVIDPKTVSEAERSHDALAFARYNTERDAVLAKRVEDAEAGVVVPGKSYGEHNVDEVIEPIVIDPKTVSEAERSHDALAFARYNAERDAVLLKRMEDAEAGVVVPGKSYGEHNVDEVIEPIVIDPKTVSKAEQDKDAVEFLRYNEARDAVLIKRMEDAEAGVVVPGKSYGEHNVDEIIEPEKTEAPIKISAREQEKDALAFHKYNEEREAFLDEHEGLKDKGAIDDLSNEEAYMRGYTAGQRSKVGAVTVSGGSGSGWSKGSDKGLEFKIDAPFEKFRGLSIDGKKVSRKYYDAKAGSTIITIKPIYLALLAVGSHEMSVVYTDRRIPVVFDVAEDPKKAKGRGESTPKSDFSVEEEVEETKAAAPKPSEVKRDALAFSKYNEERDTVLEKRREDAEAARVLPGQSYGDHDVNEVVEAPEAEAPVKVSKSVETKDALAFARYNDERDAVLAKRAEEAELGKVLPGQSYGNHDVNEVVDAPEAETPVKVKKGDEIKDALAFTKYNEERDAVLIKRREDAEAGVVVPGQPYGQHDVNEVVEETTAPTAAPAKVSGSAVKRDALAFQKYTEERDAVLVKRREDAEAGIVVPGQPYGQHDVNEVVEETTAPTAAPAKVSGSAIKRDALAFQKYTEERDAVLAKRAEEAEAGVVVPGQPYGKHDVNEVVEETTAPTAAPAKVSGSAIKRDALAFQKYTEERDAVLRERAAEAEAARFVPGQSYGEHGVDEVVEEAMPITAKAKPVSAVDAEKDAILFDKYNRERDEKVSDTVRDNGPTLSERDYSEMELARDAIRFKEYSENRDDAIAYEEAAVDRAIGRIHIDGMIGDSTVIDANGRIVLRDAPTKVGTKREGVLASELVDDALAFEQYSKERDAHLASKVLTGDGHIVIHEEYELNAAKKQTKVGETSDMLAFERYSKERDELIARAKMESNDDLEIRREHEEYDPDLLLERELYMLSPEITLAKFEGEDEAKRAEREYNLIHQINDHEDRVRRARDMERLVRKEAMTERAIERLERRRIERPGSEQRLPADALVLNRGALKKEIKQLMKRDLKYMKTRLSAELSMLEVESEAYALEFTKRSFSERREIALTNKDLRSARRDMPRIIRLEKRDNKRYTSFATKDLLSRAPRGNIDVEALAELRIELVELLRRRDEINERLTALYIGSEKGKRFAAKKDKIDLKARNKEHRKQRSLYNKLKYARISKKHSEILTGLMDEQTELSATIAKCKFTLRKEKPTGRAKRECKELLARSKRTYRKNKGAIKRITRLAIAEAKVERQLADQALLSWAMLLLLLGAVCAAIWRLDDLVALAQQYIPFIDKLFPQG
ncbi:MAG: hypothetical protein IKC32_00040 [Clostridia bacterium]|nr:hypothetical protein [Clostridia bacterium]